MSFLEVKKNNFFLLKIRAKPNSKIQKIAQFSTKDPFITILLRSKAINNKANKELVNLIKNKLNLSPTQIKIVSGVKSSNKVIKIDYTERITEGEILDLLRA
jgi:uncharacterized protein YggU (UPF0235/DUF167 family)